MATVRFLSTNGVISTSSEIPPVSTFLENHPGAYTTTRTHNSASCILFWERHLRRLSNSLRILLHSNPQLVFGSTIPQKSSFSMPMDLESMTLRRVNDSVRKMLPFAFKGRNAGEELAITALIGGNYEKLRAVGELDEELDGSVLDVYIHIGLHVPPLCGIAGNGARLAVVGSGRDVAEAKYADWVRQRKQLDKLRPSSTTELLLADGGDRILEGCVTNFFIVCLKMVKLKMKTHMGTGSWHSYEVQTAPVRDGVLPGVIRQVVIEICSSKGIAVREVSPSWSMRETWQEAFITSSLRIVQHVEAIQAPKTWTSLQSKTWQEISWEEKQFKEGPGNVTALIQREIMERAGLEECPFAVSSG
ncbi:hypothetical protein Ancab_023489 [Ancistrocladus abbreviatus]